MRRLSKTTPSSKPVVPEYMLTYGDMMTLILCFFVLLVSFSNTEQNKFTMAISSLKGALGVLPSAKGTVIPIFNMPVYQIIKKQDNKQMDKKMEDLKLMLNKNKLNENMTVEQSKDQIHIKISDGMLFESGSADLKETANAPLNALIGIIELTGLEVRIEGHTDNIPIRNEKFPSNWELSLARSLAISRFFINNGVNPSRFQIIGYGEYKPLADNQTPEGRKINRRVEIYINLKDEIQKTF